MPPSEIDELRQQLDRLELSGKRVIPFKGLPVMDRAFFPGGNGLYLGCEAEMPKNGVLVLGSNFGCVADYLSADETLIRRDEVNTSHTWKGIFRIFAPQTGIPYEQCFFTNAWPFLHAGTSNMTKGLTHVWLEDRRLMQQCLDFFDRTLAVLQPRLVIALGPGVAAFISRYWPLELQEWSGNSVASMDERPVMEVGYENRFILCTAITHPSHSNSWRRKPPFQGTEGEIELLRQAASKAGLNKAGSERS
jgi:hypothetical protein